MIYWYNWKQYFIIPQRMHVLPACVSGWSYFKASDIYRYGILPRTSLPPSQKVVIWRERSFRVSSHLFLQNSCAEKMIHFTLYLNQLTGKKAIDHLTYTVRNFKENDYFPLKRNSRSSQRKKNAIIQLNVTEYTFWYVPIDTFTN